MVIKDGEPWAVAADVCRVLEIQNSRDAVSSLDEDEKNTVAITDGINRGAGNPTFNIISESGIYSLIFRSRKESAKKFRKWVTAEVLPALRKTGTYSKSAATTTLRAWLEANPIPLKEMKEFAGLVRENARLLGDAPVRRKVNDERVLLYKKDLLEFLWQKHQQERQAAQTAKLRNFSHVELWYEVTGAREVLDILDKVPDPPKLDFPKPRLENYALVLKPPTPPVKGV